MGPRNGRYKEQAHFLAFVLFIEKNQQHPAYGLGKVRTTGGSDNTTRRTERTTEQERCAGRPRLV